MIVINTFGLPRDVKSEDKLPDDPKPAQMFGATS